MSNPAEGPRQVAEMVEVGIEGLNILSITLIAIGALFAGAFIWVALAALAETLKERGKK